ncbi:MAG: hypothetical protein CTY31_06790 [Hyphomicrobium sp.]|nr:MAG: hypothetical protein CTY31_06790 [Hyphomicrobium sp.]
MFGPWKNKGRLVQAPDPKLTFQIVWPNVYGPKLRPCQAATLIVKLSCWSKPQGTIPIVVPPPRFDLTTAPAVRLIVPVCTQTGIILISTVRR